MPWATRTTTSKALASSSNEVLRDDYISDCAKGVARWNRTIKEAGIDFELQLPHRGFHRRVGAFAGHHLTPDGRLVEAEEWGAGAEGWLPTDADRAATRHLGGHHRRGASLRTGAAR